MSNLTDAEDAAALASGGEPLAVDGFVGSATSEELLCTLESRSQELGGNLTFQQYGRFSTRGQGVVRPPMRKKRWI